MAPAFERYRPVIPDFGAFLEALRSPVPTHLRVNTLRVGHGPFREAMAASDRPVTPVADTPEAYRWDSAENPGSTLAYFRGWYQVQGLTSMIPALVLGAQGGERVLDLCAAPGGKTTYLAQLTGNRAMIVANDVSYRRIGILRSHADRLGITSVVVTRYQGQHFPLRVRFDRILVDPPCSAEGTFRFGGRPPLTEDPEVSRRLQRLQRMLVGRALHLLKPGGLLVYSTCTYAPEENEAVLHPLLEAEEAELVATRVPLPCAPGLGAWDGHQFHPALKQAVRFYPHLVNSWGFFIACLRKPG
jgi:NOL1/NOP2/sun family putative RNA methylase